MKNVFLAITAAMVLTAGAASAQTVNGAFDAAEGYLNATNQATGINTNSRFGFGDSSKSEIIRARATATHLYIYIEGSLHSDNRVLVLIDSDNSSATGVSGTFPSGSFGESNGLARFTDVADGGWDTLISMNANNSNPPTQTFVSALGWTSAGALQLEDYLGTGGANVLIGNATDAPGVFRTITDTNATPVQFGVVPGDALDNGLEFGIPVGYLGAAIGSSFRLAVINTNNSSGFHSNSTIPENANSGNLGGGSGIADLATLTAPVFRNNASVSDWTLMSE